MPAPAVDLSGKTACVTGAGQGLGREIALALAGAGADLALVGRTPETLAGTAEECAALGVRAVPMPCDVTARPDVDALFERVHRELGGPHILVNNAGISRPRPILECADADWHDTLSLNLSGVFFCCRAAGRHMVPARAGKVINLGSSAGSRGRPNQVAYAASKAGLAGFTQALAVEWAPHNIQVNCLAPARFPTSMTAERMADPEDTRRYLQTIPLGRYPEIGEIRGLALFLASDQSSYLTGQTVYLDGGSSAL